MKINIKSSTGDKFTIDVESKTETISEFKGRLAELSSIPKDAQRLIFRGHVLKDNQTIQELIDNHKMEDGHTMHLVRGTMPSGNADSTGAAATTPGAPGTTPNQAGTAQPGMGGMPDFSNGGNMFSPENMMMPNGMTPESLGQLMDSPLMRTLTDNPELVRQMILSNPQLQQFREQNPEIAQLFNNPETFRQALETMRNPSMMSEVLRQTDRQMANIEMTPGGFDALRNLYQYVQTPLMDAVRNPESTNNSNATNTENAGQENPFSSLFNTPSAQPMPNPWDRSATANTTAPTGNTNTAGAGAGTTPGANPQANPFASMMGSMGGLGGLGTPGQMPSAEDLARIQSNPAFQETMQQMMSNPQMFEQMTQVFQNAMRQNPQIAEMMRDPEFVRQMSDPNLMREVSNMMRTMQGGQNPTTGSTDAQPGTETAGSSPSGQPDMAAMARMLQGMQMNRPSQTQITPEQAEERFSSQLTQLQDMGFFDRQLCVQALIDTGGNVSAAVERLLNMLG
eukprot:CAMPEP_0184740158 /NCGR_PEP_ID=MMETSP0315-20130426/3163_1 /TAXON_ID=101924 /ORGANISM="Rhodosorus marinus, Strain UTEX LB 2760" /LENGTH=509 /DNA_ID=CAMNT_0027209643 /DNA_START=114 /DNA_END=1643 /DNA_ORIENTATION=+